MQEREKQLQKECVLNAEKNFNFVIMNLFKFLDKFGKHLGCHQIPERSFKIKKKKFPLCSRCTGILLGQILMIVLIVFGINFSLLISLILLGVMFLDWFLQNTIKFYSRNLLRFLTGLIGGIGLINLYYWIIVWVINFLVMGRIQYFLF